MKDITLRTTPDEERTSAVELATVLLHSRCSRRVIPARLNKMLSMCIWYWTEAHGKYGPVGGKFGCQYWTNAAKKLYRANIENDESNENKGLQHEHVVPLEQIVIALLDLTKPTHRAVRNLFNEMAVACVVTRDEHKRLPDVSWHDLRENRWERYLLADIKPVDTWVSSSHP